MSILLLLILSIFSAQDIDKDKIYGIWQVEKVVYLDQQPVRAKDGEKMQWQFTHDGVCIDITHQSKAKFTIKGDQLNLDGYSNTIEKLTDQHLVIRENKQFFIRRIYFKKVN